MTFSGYDTIIRKQTICQIVCMRTTIGMGFEMGQWPQARGQGAARQVAVKSLNYLYFG
jgi:hypothetical protein